MRQAANKTPLIDAALRMTCGTLKLIATIAITNRRMARENISHTLQDNQGRNNQGGQEF